MLAVIEKVMVLQNVDDFSEVSTEQLANLAAICDEVEFPSGRAIYNEGDPSDAMYLVLEGKVRLHVNELDVSIAGPNAAFGTWALFDDELRVTTATTLEETRLLRIFKEDFIDVLAEHVEVTRGVLKAMVKRLRGLVGRVTPRTGSTG